VIFDDLIYDRTAADADRAAHLNRLGPGMTAAERAEFLSGLRGAYGPSDWNRVEESVSTLAGPLELDLTTKTDWNAGDVWTVSDGERYLSNLLDVTSQFLESERLPATIVNLDIDGANGIEAALWVSATGLLWAQDGAVYASDGLLRVTKQEVL